MIATTAMQRQLAESAVRSLFDAEDARLAAQHNLDCPTGPRTDEEETAAMLALIEADSDYISALGALRAAIPM